MAMEMTQGVAPTNNQLFAFTVVVTQVMNKLRAIFVAHAKAKRERENIRALQMLNDRMLEDIGVTRTEIALHVREAAAKKAGF